jgi:MFS family permease
MDEAIEKSAMRKVYFRLLPFALLSYVLAYIDRINVSFAGAAMQKDLALSATAYGFALGTFFLGYYIFEVPSNVIMEKVGARIWIARIMITWGLFAGLMAFVHDVTSFSIVRFLLGIAEAGFFPGMLLYFTYWFPRQHHARIVSGFLVGLPFAVAVGAPISFGLLSLDGLFGFKGWQIMYIAEALPTIIVGILTLIVLTDRPEQARFLTAEEKAWLSKALAADERAKTRTHHVNLDNLSRTKVLLLALMFTAITLASLAILYYTPLITAWMQATFGAVPPVVVVLVPYIFGTIGLLVWARVADLDLLRAMLNGKVLLLALNYFGIVTASLGMLYFIPQMIKGLANMPEQDAHWLAAVPYLCAVVGILILSMLPKRQGERQRLFYMTAAVVVLGLVQIALVMLGWMDLRSVAWLTMIPYICGGIGMVVWGRVSDAMGERRWNLLGACVVSTLGLVLAGYTMGAWPALVGMSIAAIGFYGSKGPFFAMPPLFLSGTALAAGFAWINCIGNLGGTVGPYYVGYMRDLTSSFAGGLFGLALLALVAAAVCAFWLHIPHGATRQAPAAAPAE